jgi:hypothetical protein
VSHKYATSADTLLGTEKRGPVMSLSSAGPLRRFLAPIRDPTRRIPRNFYSVNAFPRDKSQPAMDLSSLAITKNIPTNPAITCTLRN